MLASWLLVLVLFCAMMAGGAFLVTALIRAPGRRRLAETEVQQILEELTKVSTRLNDVDERVADITLMVDEASRPAIEDDRSERD